MLIDEDSLPRLPNAASYWDRALNPSALGAEIDLTLGRAGFCAALGIAESTLSGWLSADRVPAMAKVAFGELQARMHFQDKIARIRRSQTGIVKDGGAFQIVAFRSDTALDGQILARDVKDPQTARMFAGAPAAIGELCALREELVRDWAELGTYDIFAARDERLLRSIIAMLGREKFAEKVLNNQIANATSLNVSDILQTISPWEGPDLGAVRVFIGEMLDTVLESDRKNELSLVLWVCELGISTRTSAGEVLSALRRSLGQGDGQGPPPADTAELAEALRRQATTEQPVSQPVQRVRQRRGRASTRSEGRGAGKPVHPTTRLVGERLLQNRGKPDAEILAVCRADHISTKPGTIRGLRNLIGSYERCLELAALGPDEADRRLRAIRRNAQVRVGLVWLQSPAEINLEEFEKACNARGIPASEATIRQIWRYFPLCRELLSNDSIGDGR